MPSLQSRVAATSTEASVRFEELECGQDLFSQGQNLVGLLPLTIEGVVCVSLVFIRALRVQSGAVVWRERKVLLDSPDEIRVGDPVPSESDHDVRMPLGGVVGGICGEAAGE